MFYLQCYSRKDLRSEKKISREKIVNRGAVYHSVYHKLHTLPTTTPTYTLASVNIPLASVNIPLASVNVLTLGQRKS